MASPIIRVADPAAGFRARRVQILDAVARSFDSGCYILGDTVERFEKAFAGYIGVAHGIGCANGTDALEIALRTLGVGPGMAVFTVSHTAVCTVAAIERAGGVPVLVDIDPRTFTMSPASLDESITWVKASRQDIVPSVVLPVHLYGQACDMGSIMDIAGRHGLAVVEDCAQAHGGRYEGKLLGTFGDMAAFSCYPTKNLGALGDAGIIVTSDSRLAERARSLRQYGWNASRISDFPGVNSRLDPVQAAILEVQLAELDNDNRKRRDVAKLYESLLPRDCLVVPQVAAWAEHVFHLYVVLCDERDSLAAYLAERNIGTGVHYSLPAHMQPAYAGRVALAPGGLPATEAIVGKNLSLPMHPHLSEEDVRCVCDAILAWCGERRSS